MAGYDAKTGKPLDKSYLEKDLPRFLQYDLDEFIQGMKDDVTHFDCLWSELSGSINSAFYGGQISNEQAEYLRKTYLYVQDEDDDLL